MHISTRFYRPRLLIVSARHDEASSVTTQPWDWSNQKVSCVLRFLKAIKGLCPSMFESLFRDLIKVARRKRAFPLGLTRMLLYKLAGFNVVDGS